MRHCPNTYHLATAVLGENLVLPAFENPIMVGEIWRYPLTITESGSGSTAPRYFVNLGFRFMITYTTPRGDGHYAGAPDPDALPLMLKSTTA